LRLRFNSNLPLDGGIIVNATGSVTHPDYLDDARDGNDVAIVILNETLSLATVTLNSDASVPADGDSVYSKSASVG
jgi:hypothetical protein